VGVDHPISIKRINIKTRLLSCAYQCRAQTPAPSCLRQQNRRHLATSNAGEIKNRRRRGRIAPPLNIGKHADKTSPRANFGAGGAVERACALLRRLPAVCTISGIFRINVTAAAYLSTAGDAATHRRRQNALPCRRRRSRRRQSTPHRNLFASNRHCRSLRRKSRCVACACTQQKKKNIDAQIVPAASSSRLEANQTRLAKSEHNRSSAVPSMFRRTAACCAGDMRRL